MYLTVRLHRGRLKYYMLFLFTEQSCKNCYRRKINLFCYFCWCKSKIIKNTFQCLQWQKSVGSYSCRFALSVAWQNKMTAMLKVPSYCKPWKINSRIISSKNNHTLIFFFSTDGFQYILQNSVQDQFPCSCQLSCFLASSKLCMLLLMSGSFLLALWRPGFVSHLYLPWSACLAVRTLLAPDPALAVSSQGTPRAHLISC